MCIDVGSLTDSFDSEGLQIVKAVLTGRHILTSIHASLMWLVGAEIRCLKKEEFLRNSSNRITSSFVYNGSGWNDGCDARCYCGNKADRWSFMLQPN